MSYEAYHQFARFGILILIVVLNTVPYVRETLQAVTDKTGHFIGSWFGIPPVFF